MPAELPGRTWWAFLAACVAVRVAVPLAALAAEGTALPGLPAYRYGPFYGDANGYYATARELVASAARGALPLAAIAAGGALALALAVRRAGWRSLAALAAAAGTAAAGILVLVLELRPTGIPALGWPLVWALPLAPLRAFPGVDPDLAFAVGLALSLLANAATVVAIAYVGLRATGRASIGLLAAALLALWPFVPGLAVGPVGWENGTWNVDVGLHLYAEPLSTALVAGAVALLLSERSSDVVLALAGLALGYATFVKLTNAVVVLAILLAVLVWRGTRAAALVAAASLVLAPAVVAFWARGFASTYDGAVSSSSRVWSLSYVSRAFGDSLLFRPALLLALVPLALLGAATLRRRPLALLLAPIVPTVLLYSVYLFTPLHPRFFYVALPFVLVLDAAGLGALLAYLRRRRPRRVRVL